jgi:hypothetical protein
MDATERKWDILLPESHSPYLLLNVAFGKQFEVKPVGGTLRNVGLEKLFKCSLYPLTKSL